MTKDSIGQDETEEPLPAMSELFRNLSFGKKIIAVKSSKRLNYELAILNSLKNDPGSLLFTPKIVVSHYYIFTTYLGYYSRYLQRILHSTTIGDEYFTVLEAYLGGNLHQHIINSPNRRLQVNVARVYSAELIDALFFLYRHNCIHRDIKSHNVVLDHRGRAKLCDFGSSIFIHENRSHR